MLVKRLVEMYGSTVHVRSEGDGKGSVFTVRRPLETAATATPQPATAALLADRRRILLVNDNRDAAESLVLVLVLVLMLTLDRYAAHAAHSGTQALVAGAQLQPDVVLMDIGMPLMSGHDACRRMRRQPRGQGITIVALTGLGLEADRPLSGHAGFDSHLAKPVDMAVLRALLSGVARGTAIG